MTSARTPASPRGLKAFPERRTASGTPPKATAATGRTPGPRQERGLSGPATELLRRRGIRPSPGRARRSSPSRRPARSRRPGPGQFPPVFWSRADDPRRVRPFGDSGSKMRFIRARSSPIDAAPAHIPRSLTQKSPGAFGGAASRVPDGSDAFEAPRRSSNPRRPRLKTSRREPAPRTFGSGSRRLFENPDDPSVEPFQAFDHMIQGLKKTDVAPPSFLPGPRKSSKSPPKGVFKQPLRCPARRRGPWRRRGRWDARSESRRSAPA